MPVKDLYQIIRTEECCLWIGAGFSRYAGYPSASELQEMLFNDLGVEQAKECTPKGSLSAFCEDYQVLKGRGKLVDRLQQVFGVLPKATEHHDLLAKISYFKTIITTNYDRLIEDRYSANDCVVIKCDTDVPDVDNRKVKVYKIHGDVMNGDSMVITSSDYSKHYNRNFKDPFWASIIHEISTKHIIFLGYGYEDENIWSDFDYVHKILDGKQKKRFMVSPFFTELKIKKLKQKRIIPLEMTGEVFLKGIIPELQKNLIVDLRNNLVSADIALELTRNLNLSMNISSSSEGTSVLGLSRMDGSTEHVVSMSIDKQEIIDRYKKFNESYDQMEFGLKKDELKEFSMSVAGFELLDLDFLKELRIAHIPSSNGKCVLEFPSQDIEITDIGYKHYNDILGKAMIQLDYQGFQVIIKISIEGTKAAFTLQVIEPEKGGRVSTYCRLYETLCLFFEGQSFVIHRENKLPVNFTLYHDGDYEVYKRHLNNYQNLRKLEKVFGITFPLVSNVSFGEQDIEDLKKVFSVAVNGGYMLHDIEGHEFRELPKDPDLAKAMKRNFAKGKWLIVTPESPVIIRIFDVELNLGSYSIEMFEPKLIWHNRRKSSMLLKSSNDQYIYRFAKYGKSRIKNTEVLWEKAN